MGFAAEARRLGGTERVRKEGKGFTAEAAEGAEMERGLLRNAGGQEPGVWSAWCTVEQGDLMIKRDWMKW